MPDDIRILYVDDEPSLLELGKFFLERSGRFSVDTITSALAALSLQNTKRYDAIISDYQMPEMDGIEFLKKIRSSGNTIPFILFTGRRREEVVIQALNEGADFYLQKGGEPASLFAELSHKIRYAVMRRHAEDSLKQNEARIRQIFDLVPPGIVVKDGRPVHSP
jgi:DNA-binding response OmpR family regulator